MIVVAFAYSTKAISITVDIALFKLLAPAGIFGDSMPSFERVWIRGLEAAQCLMYQATSTGTVHRGRVVSCHRKTPVAGATPWPRKPTE